MDIKILPTGEIEENLHHLRVLQTFSQDMKPEVRKAIDDSITIFLEEIRSRQGNGYM